MKAFSARCVLGLAALASVSARLPAQQPATASITAPSIDAITAARLRADLMFLAGDGFRGRLVETPENQLAHEWVKARLEWLGLKPLGQVGSYNVPFQLIRTSLGAENELALDWSGTVSRHAVGGDWHPRAFSGTGRAHGPLTFAGFGVVAPKFKRDELGADVRGKVVLMLDHEPGENDPDSPFDGVVSSEHASQLRRATDAQDRGAVAVLFVADVHNHPAAEDFGAVTRAYWPARPPRLDRYQLASWVQRLRIPVGQVSVALAEQMVRGSGRTLASLATAAEAGGPVVTLPGVTATVSASVARVVVPARNVVAVLEGADPVLKNEFVLVSAHVDHNGADGDQIWAGADDDGSGTVALLAIADAYTRSAAAGLRPKRSILFVSFDAEERGPLSGAWGFAEAPPVPMARIAAVLNLDMIGRSEEVPAGGGTRFRGLDVQSGESNRNTLNLFGWSRSATLTAAIDAANVGSGLVIKKMYDNNISQLLRRTDVWPFLQHGVPGVTFSTGLHPDYHTIYDRPEKIEYAKLERITRLVYQASWNLAQSSTRPQPNTR